MTLAKISLHCILNQTAYKIPCRFVFLLTVEKKLFGAVDIFKNYEKKKKSDSWLCFFERAKSWCFQIVYMFFREKERKIKNPQLKSLQSTFF